MGAYIVRAVSRPISTGSFTPARLASTVFQSFVAADSASETFASLKRIHGLMPYFMLKAALKISNPIGMIRTMLDLFMAQPFGGRSLLQRCPSLLAR